MKTLSIHDAWKSKLDKAAAEWRRGDARQKFVSTVLAFLQSQRDMPHIGEKNCYGMPCVPVPSEWIRGIYADNPSRMKFVKVCEAHGLVIKDRSWISPSYAEKLGVSAHCDKWHFTEPESYGAMVDISYDTRFGLCAKYADWLRKADSKQWGVYEFRGGWAINAYDKGEINWVDYTECAVMAKVINEKGFDDDKHLYREYTPLAMCPKHLRQKCFVCSASGDGMGEVFDLNGAFFSMSRLGAGIAGVYSRYGGMHDVDYKNFREDLKWGTIDIYKRLFERMKKLDPLHKWYGGVWNEKARKDIKVDVQYCFNETLDKLDEWEAAYTYTMEGVRSWDVRRRRWLLWRAMKHEGYYAWLVSLMCKINDKFNNRKGSFFTVAAAGEKCFFSLVVELLTKRGFAIERLHDSVWSSDKGLLDHDKRMREQFVAHLLQEWEREVVENDPDYEANRRKDFSDKTKIDNWIIRLLGQRLSEEERKELEAALQLTPDAVKELKRRISRKPLDRPADALS